MDGNVRIHRRRGICWNKDPKARTYEEYSCIGVRTVRGSLYQHSQMPIYQILRNTHIMDFVSGTLF